MRNESLPTRYEVTVIVAYLIVSAYVLGFLYGKNCAPGAKDPMDANTIFIMALGWPVVVLAILAAGIYWRIKSDKSEE
jgi:hypothetical protein